MIWSRYFLLLVILTATFGAGTFDVLFPDVIPIRPYTSIFQTAHSLLTSSDNLRLSIQAPLMLMSILIIGLLLVSLTLMILHVPIPILISPLGARGSHSRANRRAGAGWKDISRKQNKNLSSEEQFRILMEVFGRPKMVIIYPSKQKEKT